MGKTPSQYDENLDRAAILERLEGSQELLAELIHLFLGEAPELIGTMRKALHEGNAVELARTAHSLKGAASNFSAYGTANAASKVEIDAKKGDLESAKANLATLELFVEHLLPELSYLCEVPAE